MDYLIRRAVFEDFDKINELFWQSDNYYGKILMSYIIKNAIQLYEECGFKIITQDMILKL